MLLSLVVLVPLAAQAELPASLREMADTEREFARTARVKGVRDAFLEFFADDSLALTPAPVPAKDGLRKQQARPFSENGIIWEPRTGDVAASGEVGWLTGPATFTAGPEAKPTGYGCYLSIWRRQTDGRWRVFIDIGTPTPELVAFPPGLTRTTVDRPHRGGEAQAAAAAGLLESDRRLNERIGADGAASAYGAVLTGQSRLHRPGYVPLVGTQAIAAWLAAHATGVGSETTSGEASQAGDFGYTYGVYTRKSEAPERGPYVRVWSRDQDGRWWLMADVAHPARE